MSKCLCGRLTINGNCTGCGLRPMDCEACQSIEVVLCKRCGDPEPLNKVGFCGRCEEMLSRA